MKIEVKNDNKLEARRCNTMYNTEIYVKPEYTELGIKELVRIVFNPYGRPAKDILKEWILPEYWDQCYAINVKCKENKIEKLFKIL